MYFIRFTVIADTYKKPRSISGLLIGQIVEEVIFNFVENLIENSDELNDCHKRVLINFLALVEAATLIYDVIGLLRFGIAQIMLSAIVPLLVLPTAYATTRALVACNCQSDTSSRSINSVRASNSGNDCSISTIIHMGAQGKHIIGHNNYIPGKSIISVDDFHADNVISTRIINANKVKVDFGIEIGLHVTSTGIQTPTTWGIIHSGRRGAHIVPALPDTL